MTCPNITIRWDPTKASTCSKLVLPFPCEANAGLSALIKACQPSTFGPLGEEVPCNHDSILELESSAFSTNFNPYDCGIADTIAQLLLPSISQTETLQLQGVRAELCKLTVC